MAHKKADIERVVELEKGGVKYCYGVYYKYDGYREHVEYANHEDGAIRHITEFKAEWLPKHVQKFMAEHTAEIHMEMPEEDFVAYRYTVDKP